MRDETVLLVDDEPVILATLAADLKHAGFSIQNAQSGEQAVTMIQKQCFDLVVIDLVMPGISGIAVLQAVKEHCPRSGAVILTGYGDMQSAIEALRLGADEYLLKPWDRDELLLRIRRCLEKLENQRQLRLYEKLLSVCVYCKSIRDDTLVRPGSGKWVPMETYLHQRTGTVVSHGCCPVCYEQHQED